MHNDRPVCEQSHDREEVAKNAHTFLRSLTALCEFGGGCVALTDRGKDFKLDSRLLEPRYVDGR